MALRNKCFITLRNKECFLYIKSSLTETLTNHKQDNSTFAYIPLDFFLIWFCPNQLLIFTEVFYIEVK